MRNGYVKLWRKSQDSQVFSDPGVWKLWCLCLMKASHKVTYVTVEQQKEPVKVLPGQFVTGRYSLHSEYYFRRILHAKSPSTLWRWMKLLENMGNLHIQTNSRYSLVTIINWDAYQGTSVDSEQPNEQPMNSRCTADEQPMHTNKNVKKRESMCPYQQIVDLYHEILPELPRVQKLSQARRGNLNARWNENGKARSLEWWKGFFEFVRESDFLMGKVSRQGKRFKANLEWLTKEGNFLKVKEGNYHD